MGRVGLSEITVHGDHAYMMERDSKQGSEAVIKKICRVPLADMQSCALGGVISFWPEQQGASPLGLRPHPCSISRQKKRYALVSSG